VRGLFPFLKSLFKDEEKDKNKEKKEKTTPKTEESNYKALDTSKDKKALNSSQTLFKQQEKQLNTEKDSKKSQVIDEREIIWEMNKKLDELLEIKELYEDMLDWMVEISKKEDLEGRDESRQVSTKSRKVSNLSPRLRQILEIVGEKGELNSSELSEELDLSRNRCSELLNTLFKADYLSKKRVGRKVFYRLNMNKEDLMKFEG